MIKKEDGGPTTASLFVKLTESIRGPVRTIRRILPYLWAASPKWTVLSTVFIILEVVSGIGILYLLKLLVDVLTTKLGEGADGIANLGEVWLFVGLTALASVLFLGARQFGNLAREAQGLHVADYMNRLIHTRAVAADLAFFESSDYFDTLHRAKQKGTNRPAQVVTHLLMLIKSAIMLAAVVALIFTISPWLVPILLLLVLPPLAGRLFFTRRLYEWEKRRTQLERRAGYLDWLITFYLHAKELRLNRLGDYLRDRFSGYREIIRSERLGITRQRTMVEFATGLIGTVGFFGCLAFLARETAYGRNSLGDLVLFLLVFQRAQTAGQNLVQQISSVYEDHLYLGLVFRFLEVEPTIHSPEHPVQPPERWQEGLRLENVSFRYPGTERAVLHDVTLEVRPNQVVAIVGSNGSGKTTLIKLLCRLYDPTDGRITLDGTDIRHFDLEEYRKQFGVIFQDFTRYFDSVRENIRFGDIRLPPDSPRIPDAARRAGADELIASLSLNYDTFLGRMFEGGHEISAGQWQKLALARAFVNQSRLMVMDEPTSALDPNAEFELFESFRERLEGRSAIVISHRLSTIRLADFIYVLNEGRVVESGEHEDLMENRGATIKLSLGKASITERPESLLKNTERRGGCSAESRQDKRYLYQVYGLTVESEIELPELVAVKNREPDVEIRFGQVPRTLDNVIEKWPWCTASDSEFLFAIKGVAKYHVACGKTITIERRLGLSGAIPTSDIRLWLLGTAFAALLHQRGLLPLHVSAVKAPTGLWAFTGNSGEGKSTLAGFLHKSFSYELVSDDVAAIDPDNSASEIYAGPRKLKLWADALDRLNFNGYRMAQDMSNTDKYQIYLDGEAKHQPDILHALVALESAPDDESATIERLHGIEAFNVCFGATYSPFMSSWFKRPEKHMMDIAALCRKIRVYRFRRPRCLNNFDRNLEPLTSLMTTKSLCR